MSIHMYRVGLSCESHLLVRPFLLATSRMLNKYLFLVSHWAWDQNKSFPFQELLPFKCFCIAAIQKCIFQSFFLYQDSLKKHGNDVHLYFHTFLQQTGELPSQLDFWWGVIKYIIRHFQPNYFQWITACPLICPYCFSVISIPPYLLFPFSSNI